MRGPDAIETRGLNGSRLIHQMVGLIPLALTVRRAYLSFFSLSMNDNPRSLVSRAPSPSDTLCKLGEPMNNSLGVLAVFLD